MTCVSRASQQISLFSRRPGILYAAVFSWNAMNGGRFTAPFLRNEVGFDDSLTGLSLAFQMALAAIISPLCGSMADERQKKYKNGRVHVLMAGLTLGTIVILLHGIAHIIPSFSLFYESNYQYPYMRQIIILWHVSLRLLSSVAFAFIMPVVDGLTLAHLESEKNSDRTDYGKERLHGAIWWAIANIALGPLIDMFGFKVMYYTSVISLGLSFAAIFIYTSNTNNRNEGDVLRKVQNETSHNVVRKENHSHFYFIALISGTLYGASFLLNFFILNSGTSVVENLIFLFFDFLGGSNTICGFTVIVTVVFEIPIFHYGPLILKKIGSGKMQQIACLAFVTRVLGYSLIPKNHMALILFLEPLHGVTYAFSQLSAVEFFANFMPSGYEAQGQGIMNIFRGLGCFIGLSIGGWAEESYGPRAMYRGFSIAVFFSMLQFFIAVKFSESTNKIRDSKQDSIGEESKLIVRTQTSEKKYSDDLA